jgi:hypothetical protein
MSASILDSGRFSMTLHNHIHVELLPEVTISHFA